MSKTMRIIAIVGVLVIGGLFLYSIMSRANRNIERAQTMQNLQPSDFEEKEYEVTEVWKRIIERKNMAWSKQSYIFFKVKGEKFNFNFGSDMTDYGGSTEINNELSKYLYEGAKVKVLANKADVIDASDNSFLRKISDFLSGSNQEVEVYKLTVNDEVIFDQDIHTMPFSNRGFADVAVSKNLVFLLLGCAAIYGLSYRVHNFIKRKKNGMPD